MISIVYNVLQRERKEQCKIILSIYITHIKNYKYCKNNINHIIKTTMGKTKTAKFAYVRAEQKEQTASKKEKLKLVLKLRLLEKNVRKLENSLKRYVTNPQKKKQKKMFLKRTGQLYGAARPAISLELSEYGCGLRKFECEEQCNHTEIIYKDLWSELIQDKNLSSHEIGKNYCKTSMELAEIYYALHRTDDTISVLKRIVELDGKYDFVEAQNALNDIEIALKEEAAAAAAAAEEANGSEMEGGDMFVGSSSNSSNDLSNNNKNRKNKKRNRNGIGGNKKKRRKNNHGKKRR